MAAQTDERVDEMIVPKCRVWNIEEKQSHIQDRFHVQIVYGARHDQDQWIGVKGEQENRDLAKGYIKALVAPTEGITVNYPEEIHDVLINPTVLVKLEQQSKAVVMFSPGQRGELRILGCDTLSVTLALSTVEDLINKYLQEQTNESATAAFKAPSQQATKRLDNELRRLSSENGVVIISEDDYSDMNNAVKRTILGWLHENQGPSQGQAEAAQGQAEMSQGHTEPVAGTSALDSPDVIIVDNDPDEHMPPRETVSPGTNLSMMLQDTNFSTTPDDGSPVRQSSLGGKHDKPATITDDESPSLEEMDTGSLSLTQNLLTIFAREKGYSAQEIQVVFETHGRNLAASTFLQLLVANRKVKADAGEPQFPADAERKIQADAKSAMAAQSSCIEIVGSSGSADSPLARAAAVAQVQFGGGSVSPPTVSSSQTPPKALNGYLTQLHKDMTEEGECNDVDELKKKNAVRQKLLHKAFEKQTSSVKKPIRRKKHKKKSAGSNMLPSSSSTTVAHGDDIVGDVHDLTANDSDSDIEFVAYYPSENTGATAKMQKYPVVIPAHSFSAKSAGVTPAQRNMLELSGTVNSGEENTPVDPPCVTISQGLRGKVSELDDFSLPFAVNEPSAASTPSVDIPTVKADADPKLQVVDLTSSMEDITRPISAVPKQNGAIAAGRGKCGTMPGPQLAKGSIEAVAASATAAVANMTELASKKMRYTPPTALPTIRTFQPFMWQPQQQLQQQQQQLHWQLQQQQQRQQLQLQKQHQQLRQQQLQQLRQPQQKNQPVTSSTIMPANSRLRYIVIDGSNVAMAHGNDTVFSCKGIQLCIDYFRQRGHKEITAFVPQWRTQTAIRPDHPISDQYLLNKLKAEGVLVFTPCRRVQGKNIVCYDDRFHLRLAHTTDGVIVSNDNFRDLWNDNREWRDVIENRLLMYSFVGDLFMVPDDPLGRNGPTLDELLTKPIPISYRCPQYANMSVQPSQRPWFGNGPVTTGTAGGSVAQQQQPRQQHWQSQPPATWQRVGQPLRQLSSGTWPTVASAASSSPQDKNRKTQAQPKSNPRTQQDTARLTSELKGVFPEHEDAIRTILTTHPSETDLNLLSGYVLEVAQ